MSEFIIIVESRADFETATDIAERVFCEQLSWIEDYLKDVVQWNGLQKETQFSCWQDIGKIREEAASQGIRLPRFLRRSQTLKADGAAAFKVLQLVNQLQKEREISAVIFIRDLDHQAERRTGLEQARKDHAQRAQSPAIVLGTANGKREAWVLNGFIPMGTDEESALATLRSQLQFDPTTESHRLRATTYQEPDRIRNAKVVLSTLTNDDRERECHCWQETPLGVLRERGRETGLTDYMNEVQEYLIPLLSQ